jgi:sporulation protein YlmC with PRC-barrel domain
MFRTRREEPMPLSNLVEAKVRRQDGQLIGVVDELLIDLQTGRIEYLLATDVHGQRISLRWDALDVREGVFILDDPAPHH